MQKFTVDTSTFKSMVNKASKGAGKNKTKTLTEYMFVQISDGVLSLTTTDINNYLTISEHIDCQENVYFVVDLDKFSKLVSKQTSKQITFEADEALTIKGNGKYTLDLKFDSDGESQIKLPKHEINMPEESGRISLRTIQGIIAYNKMSLAILDTQRPYLAGYCCGAGQVISSDGINMTVNSVDTFKKRVLVSPTMLELLLISKDDSLSYKIYEDKVLFESDTFKLYGVFMPLDWVEDYPVDTVNKLCQLQYASSCTVQKSAVLGAIDRLSLLYSDLEEWSIIIKFDKDAMILTTNNGKGSECIQYQGTNNHVDYMCKMLVPHLKNIISARDGETVHILYGTDAVDDPTNMSAKTITIREDDIVQVSALKQLKGSG